MHSSGEALVIKHTGKNKPKADKYICKLTTPAGTREEYYYNQRKKPFCETVHGMAV